MQTFWKNVANLVKVKTIVTLMVMLVFTVLAIRGDIAPNIVMVIVSTVVAFYFGTQHEKKIIIQNAENPGGSGLPGLFSFVFI